MHIAHWCVFSMWLVAARCDVSHIVHQGLEAPAPYIPPRSLHSKDEYLPPVEYLPASPSGGGGRALSQRPLDDCCQNQISMAADVPVELPQDEPEGYDYPKPTKQFELPTQSLFSPARTLDQEIPLTADDEEPSVPFHTPTTTTEAKEPSDITLPPVSDKNNDALRPARSPQAKKHPAKKLLTAGDPVHIQTLPFHLNQSDHQITKRSESKPKRSPQQGRPPFGVQISPPGPSNYPQGRPPFGVQISPPRPGNNVRPLGPVQVSPPRPGNGQGRPYSQVQISPPRPGVNVRPLPAQISPQRPYQPQRPPNGRRPTIQISPPRPYRPAF